MSDKLLPWQQEAWMRLLARLREDRLPHALLITGPVGMGKRRFGEAWLWAVLCETPAADGFACGACRACLLLAAGSHPDSRRLTPPEEGKVIGVDLIRDLIHWVALTPQYGRRKVVVIEPADKMNINAANSLLKTLEEPPPQSLLILISAQPTCLPVTVISRCQRVHFSPPPAEEASAWLRQQAAGIRDPRLVLKLADGAPLRALDLAAAGALDNRQALMDVFEGLVLGKLEAVAAADAALKIGVLETLQCLYSCIADMIALISSDFQGQVVNEDMKDRLRRMAGRATARILFEQLDQTAQALRLAERQLNPQLLLEDRLIAWQDAVQARPLIS